jgi:2-hydroxy-3-keto-5-methylthiopentenyl-1-phosphate phosphatase
LASIGEYGIDHREQVSGIDDSGVDDIVHHFIQKNIAHSHPTIVANKIKIHPDRWEIIYIDDTDYGHDKGTQLRLAKQKLAHEEEKPLIVFIGDGVSDLSAAKEADIVFAKQGKDLEVWCKREGIMYTPWHDFSVILKHLQSLK